MELTSCPECGHPAEVLGRDVLESTDGPVEHARVRCVQRHFFFLPVEVLSRSRPEPRDRQPSDGARASEAPRQAG